MAFCTKCGKEIGPSGVCDCQQPKAAETTESGAAPKTVTADASAAAAAPAVPQKQGKKFVPIVIAAAAVVLLVIICSVLFGGSYKTPLKDLTKLINKQSTDVMAYQKALASPMDYDAVKDIFNICKNSGDFADGMEEQTEWLEDFYEDLEGLKLRFEITKAEKLDSDELKDISKDYRDYYKDYYKDYVEELEEADNGDYEDLADELEISKSEAKKLVKVLISYYKSFEDVEVTKGYNVKLRFYGEMDSDEGKTDKIEVVILKANGSWFISNIYDLFNGMSFDDDLSSVNLYRLYSNMSFSAMNFLY